MIWFGIALGVLVLALAIAALAFHLRIIYRYLHLVVRILQEKPLFLVPHGQPREEAEKVQVRTYDGLTLNGCYFKSPTPRKGVILFGIEFDAKCWSCLPYCDYLWQAGYDIFAFEMRGQGTSPAQPGYEPLQWVTEFELEDFRAAIRYLKSRPDADPRGVGFFGISKGGSAGLAVAAEEPYVRCCVTDGIFATHTVLVPYMKKWIYIYTNLRGVAEYVPNWYYSLVGRMALERVEKERKCKYPHLESVLHKLAPRPWLMIHGGADNYIRPEMARALFDRAGPPKEIWIVDKAKHNQAIQMASEEYKRRVGAFFEQHLPATDASAPPPATADAPGVLSS